MVTIQVHVMSCRGIVPLLLAAMLELVFTIYTLSSVCNLGLHLFFSLFCCQFTLILQVSANGTCHVVLLRSFEWFLLFSFGTMYWDNAGLPSLVGTLLLNCGPYSPSEVEKKEPDGVNLHIKKKSWEVSEQEVTTALILPFFLFWFFSLHNYSPVMPSVLGVTWVWGFIPPSHALSVKVLNFWVTRGEAAYITHAASSCRWVDKAFWTVLVKDEGGSLHEERDIIQKLLRLTSILKQLLKLDRQLSLQHCYPWGPQPHSQHCQLDCQNRS